MLLVAQAWPFQYRIKYIEGEVPEDTKVTPISHLFNIPLNQTRPYECFSILAPSFCTYYDTPFSAKCFINPRGRSSDVVTCTMPESVSELFHLDHVTCVKSGPNIVLDSCVIHYFVQETPAMFRVSFVLCAVLFVSIGFWLNPGESQNAVSPNDEELF